MGSSNFRIAIEGFIGITNKMCLFDQAYWEKWHAMLLTIHTVWKCNVVYASYNLYFCYYNEFAKHISSNIHTVLTAQLGYANNVDCYYCMVTYYCIIPYVHILSDVHKCSVVQSGNWGRKMNHVNGSLQITPTEKLH